MRSNSLFSKSPVHPVGGFTLVELLIAMAVGLVVIGTAYQGFITQRRIYKVQGDVTEMLQNARAAVDFMEREMRMATTPINLNNPRDTALNPPTCDSSFSSSVTYTFVLDTVLNTTEQRGFAWDNSDSRHPKLHYTQGGSTEPLAENVSCLNIARAGNLFTITLTARTDTKDRNLRDYRSITIRTKVLARCIQAAPNTQCS